MHFFLALSAVCHSFLAVSAVCHSFLAVSAVCHFFLALSAAFDSRCPVFTSQRRPWVEGQLSFPMTEPLREIVPF